MQEIHQGNLQNFFKKKTERKFTKFLKPRHLWNYPYHVQNTLLIAGKNTGQNTQVTENRNT